MLTKWLCKKLHDAVKLRLLFCINEIFLKKQTCQKNDLYFKWCKNPQKNKKNSKPQIPNSKENHKSQIINSKGEIALFLGLGP